jgi:hypothetical protein
LATPPSAPILPCSPKLCPIPPASPPTPLSLSRLSSSLAAAMNRPYL